MYENKTGAVVGGVEDRVRSIILPHTLRMMLAPRAADHAEDRRQDCQVEPDGWLTSTEERSKGNGHLKRFDRYSAAGRTSSSGRAAASQDEMESDDSLP